MSDLKINFVSNVKGNEAGNLIERLTNQATSRNVKRINFKNKHAIPFN